MSAHGAELSDEIDAALVHLAEGGAAAQAARTAGIVERFGCFCGGGFGVTSLAAVTPAVAEAFVRAATSRGWDPSRSTMHWRRTALRLLFRAARDLGLASGDPTLDLDLPRRGCVPARPLSDDEIERGRTAALWSLSTTRRAAAWALAEATARTSELPHIRKRDVDIDGRRVWIGGGNTTRARWGELTRWGCVQVQRRLEIIGDDTPLVYGGRSARSAGQVSAAALLGDVLRRAGLGADPSVRPGSIAAWAGRGVFEKSGRIEHAAVALGVSSLDRAARIIDVDATRREPGGAGR